MLFLHEAKIIIVGPWCESFTSVQNSPLQGIANSFVLELPDVLAQCCGFLVGLVLRTMIVANESCLECVFR